MKEKIIGLAFWLAVVFAIAYSWGVRSQGDYLTITISFIAFAILWKGLAPVVKRCYYNIPRHYPSIMEEKTTYKVKDCRREVGRVVFKITHNGHDRLCYGFQIETHFPLQKLQVGDNIRWIAFSGTRRLGRGLETRFSEPPILYHQPPDSMSWA